MAQDVQDVFNKIQKIKKQQKEIRRMYADELKNNSGYQEVLEELKGLRQKKKDMETTIKENYSAEFTKLEDLKIDLESEMEMLSDIVLNKYVKGETIEVSDEYDNNYEPVFKVNFKKVY